MAKAKRKKRATPTRKVTKPKAKKGKVAVRAKPKAKAKAARRAPAGRKAAAKKAPPKPKAIAGAVDRAALLAVLETLAPELAKDPMFAKESNAPFDAAELAGYLGRANGTLGDLFGETLQGMIQSVRYGALIVVRELYRDDKQAAITTKPALEIAQDKSVAVIGDLVVEGDLVNHGVLVVTGDLTVSGAYIGSAFDYSLAAVGGTLRARDVSASGEILVGERLEANRVVHLFYNDYSSVLPVVKARALVIDDNFPALGTVEAEMQIDGTPTDEQLRTIFGASVEGLTEDDESPIRTLIRS